MSDMGDDFRAFREHKRELRNRYGVNCPVCTKQLPKAQPTILLPQQRCRVCKYVDPRPELTDEQYQMKEQP